MKRPIATVIEDLTGWMHDAATPDEQVIATVWSRTDFPDDWNRLMAIWTRADSERLIEAGRAIIEQVIQTRIREAED